MNKENGKSSKIFFCLLILTALLFISLLFGSVINLLITNPSSVKLNFSSILKNISSLSSLKTSLVVYIALLIVFVYYLIKLGFFGMFKMVNREDRAASKIHGSSRLQTPSEMAKNFGEKENKNSYRAFKFNELHMKKDFHGFIVNSFKKNGRFYIEGVQNHHAMIVGSTGSGKTTSFISPTIQANANSGYKASMLIYDLKGDLFKLHSKMLEEKGYTVLVINLKDPIHSVRFNPLSLIWDLYHEYLEAHLNGEVEKETELIVKVSNYISDISTKIVPTASGENKVWSEGSQGIIKGILWGLLEDSTDPKYDMTKDKFTFAQIGNILNRQKDELSDFLTNRDKSSMVFAKAGMIIGNDSEKTVASYLSNTQTSLDPFLEKSIEIVTATSDFDLRNLPERPHAIFIAIDDTNVACHAICSILTVQIRNYLVLHADLNGGALERTFYFLFDEFANLPKIEGFQKWMSTDRSRKLFYCVLLQSISQLKNIFNETEAKEIRDNCDLQIFMKCNETETAEYFQKLFCKYTTYSRSASINTQTLTDPIYQGTTSLTGHEVVQLDELLHIKQGTIFFHFGGMNPCKATLVPFYDKELNENGTWKKGYTKSTKINKAVEFNETFYDLMERKISFEQGTPMKKTKKEESPANPTTPGGNNQNSFLDDALSEIIDITEEVIVPDIRKCSIEEFNNMIQSNISYSTEETTVPSDTENEDSQKDLLKIMKARKTKNHHTNNDL